MKHQFLKSKLLTAVSAIALVVSVPINVQAQTQQTTGKAISDSTRDTSNATKEAFERIKAAYIDNDEKTDGSTIMIDSRRTASGMIGKNIFNVNGQSVGKIHDIILDKDGKALMVIVADGNFFGTGKLVAFNYGVVSLMNEDGDVISQLSETVMKQAKEFSYTQSKRTDTISVMPKNAYSVTKLLDGQLINQKRIVIGEIDNITFRRGRASQLIIAFDQTIDISGDKAALLFSDAKLVTDKRSQGYDFQLDTKYALQFEAYKKSIN